jgi:hypothetical protein
VPGVTASDIDRAVAILNGMRAAEQAATRGPWKAEDNENCWKLFGAVAPLTHPLQLIKAPKRDTPYAEYWPGEADSAFIVTARTALPALLAVAGGVLDRHIRRTVITTATCPRHHWPVRGLTQALARDAIRACPNCKVTERYVCSGCRHECPDDDEWPCTEIRAVVAALIGAGLPAGRS